MSYKNPLRSDSKRFKIYIRKASFFSGSISGTAAQVQGLLATGLLILLLVAIPVRADSGADLATAKADFDQVQQSIIVEIRAIDPELRGAAWGQYYRALEQLRRMDVHHQMMTRHNQDRQAEFGKAFVEFRSALDELDKILVSAVKIDPE